MAGKMRILTKRDRILGVADKWHDQYWNKHWAGSDKHDKLLALQALDLSTATEDDIEAIVGNRSWTRIKCDQCGKDVDAAVMIGGSDEYGPDTICGTCIREAAKLYDNYLLNNLIEAIKKPLPIPQDLPQSGEDAMREYAQRVKMNFLAGFASTIE